MREKIGASGLILDRLRQHGTDLTWYVDEVFRLLQAADARADSHVDRGLLRSATLQAYNEYILGWSGEETTQPMGSVLLNPEHMAQRRSQLYFDDLFAFILEHHDYLQKLGMTYETIMDHPFRTLTEIRTAIELDKMRHANNQHQKDAQTENDA